MRLSIMYDHLHKIDVHLSTECSMQSRASKAARNVHVFETGCHESGPHKVSVSVVERTGDGCCASYRERKIYIPIHKSTVRPCSGFVNREFTNPSVPRAALSDIS